MASSARYEDLKDDLNALQDKVRARLKQSINESNLNNLLSQGDGIVNLMKKEVNLAPGHVKDEIHNDWIDVSFKWQTFKSTAMKNPTSLIGYQTITGPSGQPINFEANKNLVQGTTIMERTSASLFRAQQIATETEQVGTEIIGELGEQRESLIRTRDRLDGTNEDLKRSHRIIRVINRRVVTNKCLLIVIIIMEIGILAGVVYWRFFSKKKK